MVASRGLRKSRALRVSGAFAEASGNLQDISIYIYTLPKTNIDPDNGPMEDYFPLPTRGCQVPC